MSPRAWAAFATVSTLWGVPYLFIKVAVDDGVPPGVVALARVVLGATVLLLLAWRAGKLEALRGRWKWLAAFVVAPACCAVGPMVVKRQLADLGPRASMGGSLAVAAVLLVPVALADPPSAVPSLAASGSVVALGLFCTAAALVFYGLLIAEVGAGRAVVITYINPVVAVGLGVAILGEHPGAGAIAGLLLILAGSWLSTDGRVPPGLAAVDARLGWRGRPPDPGT